MNTDILKLYKDVSDGEIKKNILQQKLLFKKLYTTNVDFRYWFCRNEETIDKLLDNYVSLFDTKIAKESLSLLLYRNTV